MKLTIYSERLAVDPVEIPRATADQHTMGNAIDSYVRQRLPTRLLDEGAGVAIEVHGIYPDHLPSAFPDAVLVNSGMPFRPDKQFNCVRPRYFLARHRGRPRLIVAVPPGRDYVLHYASLLAHYVSLQQPASSTANVEAIFRYPEAEQSLAHWTDLERFVQPQDRVLIGYVQELTSFFERTGATVLARTGNRYYGMTRLRIGDQIVCALGVRFSFWGCISAKLAARCQSLGARELIYVGKLGTLTAHDDLYRRLYVPSEFVHLDGAQRRVPFEPAPNRLLQSFPYLDSGVHMSVGTVLEESISQRHLAGILGVTSMDNEIAQIAVALSAPGAPPIAFSSVHFATDYLRRWGEPVRRQDLNLTNHRGSRARRRKRIILRRIGELLWRHYTTCTSELVTCPATTGEAVAERRRYDGPQYLQRYPGFSTRPRV